MSVLMDKLKSIMGLVSGFDDEEEIYDELRSEEDYYPVQDNLALDTAHQTPKKNNLKVLAHPNAYGYEVKVIEPRSFEESLDIVNNLREKKCIILNLHLLDAEQSQRTVDFLSGATHAIDGHQQRIGDGVFLFTPNNVAISAETEKTRVIRDAFWNQQQQ